MSSLRVPQPETAPPYSVVVVDDEYGARLQVELALMTSTKARLVGAATNGAAGAELAERLQPDVVVLDLAMPVMNGYEALPLIRKLCPNTQILVRSGQVGVEHDQAVRDLGAAGFIPKFMAPDDLARIIEHAAAKAEGTREMIEGLLDAARSLRSAKARLPTRSADGPITTG